MTDSREGMNYHDLGGGGVILVCRLRAWCRKCFGHRCRLA